MTSDEKIERAHHADRLLRDSLMVEAFDAVKAAIHKSIEDSPVRDIEGREHLFKMLKALKDARGYLEQVMNTGKVEIHLKAEKASLLRMFK